MRLLERKSEWSSPSIGNFKLDEQDDTRESTKLFKRKYMLKAQELTNSLRSLTVLFSLHHDAVTSDADSFASVPILKEKKKHSTIFNWRILALE